MSFSHSKGILRSVVGVAILVLGAGAVLSGQSQQGGLPALFEQILAAVTGLAGQTSDVKAGIEGLQASIDALGAPAESQVRTTPTVFFRTGVADCISTNVSSQPRHVKIEMINGNTGAVIFSEGGSIETAPGVSRSVGIVGGTGRTYCRFTVLDGTRADIRATLTRGGSIADDTSLLAVPAE